MPPSESFIISFSSNVTLASSRKSYLNDLQGKIKTQNADLSVYIIQITQIPVFIVSLFICIHLYFFKKLLCKIHQLSLSDQHYFLFNFSFFNLIPESYLIIFLFLMA
jgi:hypothetical protein